MADNKTATGNRDDLNVDASRCLKMRFCDSSCRRCIDICPHNAVSVDGELIIDPEKCHGCLLCTSVCPVGALEQNGDSHTCLTKLSKVPEPILGCVRTKECSNGTVACLGGLSEEHLVTLYHTLAGRLTLNITLCNDCCNHSIIAQLRQRLDALSTARLSYSNCRIEISDSAHNMNYQDESVDRRSFFKSFRNSLFQSAAVILSTSNEPSERRTEYAGKRVPIKRELLNRTRKILPQDLVVQIQKHFDSCISFDDNCTKCQACVAICPTGALKTELAEESPIFDQLICTGCGLCREFCLDSAVRIS